MSQKINQKTTSKKTTKHSTSHNIAINFNTEYSTIIENLSTNSDYTRRKLGEKMLEVFVGIFGTKKFSESLQNSEDVMVNRLHSIIKEAALEYNVDYCDLLRLSAKIVSELFLQKKLEKLFNLEKKYGKKIPEILCLMFEFVEQDKNFASFEDFIKNG